MRGPGSKVSGLEDLQVTRLFDESARDSRRGFLPKRVETSPLMEEFLQNLGSASCCNSYEVCVLGWWRISSINSTSSHDLRKY